MVRWVTREDIAPRSITDPNSRLVRAFPDMGGVGRTRMNSKLFIIAVHGAWYLTFLLGFFILAPSTDDGYYIISSLGTTLTGSPGFWIGDEFAPSFFLPTVFPFIYGTLLKLTMILGLDFGAFGFRVYQFIFILLIPVLSWITLRRIFPGDYGIRLLLLITLLSVTYFIQSVAVVRPEALGVVLFIVFLALRETKFSSGVLPAFVLALCGTMHPIFMLLAITLFGVHLIRIYRQSRFKNLKQWSGSTVAFAIPYLVLAVYYLINFTEYRQQIQGRTSVLSNDILAGPKFILDNLLFWNDSNGIEYGLFSGYPAVAFVFVMSASTLLVLSRRTQVWNHESLWLCWPILFVQWFAFLALPHYLPYLAVSSFLASLIIVLLWQRPHILVSGRRMKYLLGGSTFAICLIFIAFHAGKFVLSSEERLTPASLHSAMSPVMENPETKLYTNAARLIPPLIDNFSENGNIRLNFLYLDPDCLPPHLLERANRHATASLTNTDPQTAYWGMNKVDSDRTDEGEITFITKGAHSTIALVPTDKVYEDTKNIITRASSVTTSIDRGECSY